MELSFLELRAKEVINTQDGKKLGKACDVALCYPDNRWIGIVVPGKGFGGKKSGLFIDLKNIVKIGEDVILVNIGAPCKGSGKGKGCPPRGCEYPPRAERNFEEYE
jgi:YlmC/YmxH family sporulation protein